MKLRSKLSALGTLNLSACKNQTILFAMQYVKYIQRLHQHFGEALQESLWNATTLKNFLRYL